MNTHNLKNIYTNIWIDHSRHTNGMTYWKNSNDAKRNADNLRMKGYFVIELSKFTGELIYG